MFLKSIGFVGALVLLAGCASLSAKGERVVLTQSAADVQGCKMIGQVTAPPPYGLPDDWKKKLRNNAGELGADHVLTNDVATGTAFSCATTASSAP